MYVLSPVFVTVEHDFIRNGGIVHKWKGDGDSEGVNTIEISCYRGVSGVNLELCKLFSKTSCRLQKDLKKLWKMCLSAFRLVPEIVRGAQD